MRGYADRGKRLKLKDNASDMVTKVRVWDILQFLIKFAEWPPTAQRYDGDPSNRTRARELLEGLIDEKEDT